MKKYKLIKEYPGSPKLGCIVDNKTKSECEEEFYPINQPGGYINRYYIENQPEFWEEIIEKNYEILSFKSPYGSKLCLGSEKIFLSKQAIKEGYTIHSVKRLSDGKVFTIGDKVRHKNNVINREGIIEKLDIKLNDIWFNCDTFNTPMFYIQEKISIKPPLFTTEDGVDIFEGDKIFSVNRTNFQHCDNHRIITSNFKQSSIYKYFSTKQTAEEYILMNKPCLSIKDIQKIICNYSDNLKNKLKDVVKYK